MGYDEAFCVVPGTSPQDGETMGQITEDFLRLIFHGPIPNNALWDGALTRPLDVLVAPKNKKQLLFFLLQLKVFIILARIKYSFLSTYRYEKVFWHLLYSGKVSYSFNKKSILFDFHFFQTCNNILCQIILEYSMYSVA